MVPLPGFVVEQNNERKVGFGVCVGGWSFTFLGLLPFLHPSGYLNPTSYLVLCLLLPFSFSPGGQMNPC